MKPTCDLRKEATLPAYSVTSSSLPLLALRAIPGGCASRKETLAEDDLCRFQGWKFNDKQSGLWQMGLLQFLTVVPLPPDRRIVLLGYFKAEQLGLGLSSTKGVAIFGRGPISRILYVLSRRKSNVTC